MSTTRRRFKPLPTRRSESSWKEHSRRAIQSKAFLSAHVESPDTGHNVLNPASLLHISVEGKGVRGGGNQGLRKPGKTGSATNDRRKIPLSIYKCCPHCVYRGARHLFVCQGTREQWQSNENLTRIRFANPHQRAGCCAVEAPSVRRASARRQVSHLFSVPRAEKGKSTSNTSVEAGSGARRRCEPRKKSSGRTL